MYECCKLVGCTPCGLGVGDRVWLVPLVYECCKLVGGTPCGDCRCIFVAYIIN